MHLRSALAFFVGIHAVVLGAQDCRVEKLNFWTITVPTGSMKHVNNGPDFVVTYFEIPDLKGIIGVYEGGWPDSFSKGRSKVVHEPSASGCMVDSWLLWEDEAAGV